MSEEELAASPAPPIMAQKWDDWGGVACTNCGREAFRLLDAVCLPCHNGQSQVAADDLEAVEITRTQKKEGRQKVRRRAAEMVAGLRPRVPMVEQTECLRCQGPAMLIAVGTGLLTVGTARGASAKVICQTCGTYQL